MKTNRILASILLLAALLAPAATRAQSTLLQGGATTSGHAPMYSTSGGAGSQAVVVDSGPAGGGGAGLGLSEILQVNRTTTGTGQNGAHNCFYSAPATSASGGYVLCLDALVNGGGLISFSNFGVAPQVPLNIVVNGTTLNFSNTLPLGQIFIGNASSVATAQSVSGDCVISSTGVLTCTKTNGVAFGAMATSTDATNLTGTVASARISGSYTGITGVGTLVAGATGAGFTINLGTSTLVGVLSQANGGWGVSTAAESGVPLFAAGVPTFTTTTGTGAFVRASAASLTGASISSSSWSGGTITGLPTCSAASDACPKSYIDSIAQGQVPAAPVRLATAAVLPQTPTYANGAAGVGATLTAGSNAAIVVDGVTGVLNDRILVSQQASQLENGIYTVTTVGSGAAAWVLTRATDADTSAELVNGLTTSVQAGSTLTGSKWTLSQSAPITVGTTALPFIETSTPVSSVWSSTGSDIYNNNSGNVGVGTAGGATPGLLTLSANTDGRIFFTRTAVSNSFVGLGTTFDVWNGANVDMRFGANNTEAMRITAAANVGIGTATPSALLDLSKAVAGGSDNYVLALRNPTTAVDVRAGMRFQINASSAKFGPTIYGQNDGVTAAGNLIFGTFTSDVWAERMRMTYDGKFGLGTVAPRGVASGLDAAGTLAFTNAANIGGVDFAAAPWVAPGGGVVGWNRASGEGDFGLVAISGGGSDGGFSFWDRNTQLMRIRKNGQVGININAPAAGANLQIAGSQFISVTNPTMQQSDCYGFGGGACETDAFLSHLVYTSGATTTGAAIRGEVLMQKAAATALGVSGIVSNVGTGVASELVGVIGVTDWNGAGSGNAVWAITAGTGATPGITGAIAATNRATFTPAFGLAISLEGAATTSFVTAIDMQGFTQFGIAMHNTNNAGTPMIIQNSVGTTVYSINSAGVVFSASDARLKNDMGVIPDGALDRIAKLTPRNFSFKDDARNHKDAGFFAHEVRDIIGEAIESDATGSLMMSQGPLIAYTVKAIQELKADNDNLRECLRSVECRLMGLK